MKYYSKEQINALKFIAENPNCEFTKREVLRDLISDKLIHYSETAYFSGGSNKYILTEKGRAYLSELKDFYASQMKTDISLAISIFSLIIAFIALLKP